MPYLWLLDAGFSLIQTQSSLYVICGVEGITGADCSVGLLLLLLPVIILPVLHTFPSLSLG
jgi:hypothetical protein